MRLLSNMGERISDQEFKSILIMSLPDSWEAFTSSYQGSNVKQLRGLQQPQAQMSSQELSSVLIQEYYRRRKDDQSINSNTSYSAQYGGPPKKKRRFIPSSWYKHMITGDLSCDPIMGPFLFLLSFYLCYL